MTRYVVEYIKYTAVVALGVQLVACGQTGAAAALADGSKTAQAAVSAGQTYTVTNQQSSMALGVVGASSNDDAAVDQEQPSGATSQQWTVQQDPSGAYALINVGSDKALTLPNGNGAPGTQLNQYDYLSQANQLWHLTQNGDGSYQIVSVSSSLCVDDMSASMQAGALVQQWNCANSQEMNWALTPIGGAGSNPNQTTVAGTTVGGGTGTGSSTGGATTGSGTTTTTTPTASGYSTAQLTTDMSAVLQLHTPIYSDRNLGNPGNIAMWTPDAIQSLYNGIVTAHSFYPQFALADLAHLIISEAAQESTGNFNLPGYSEGFIQVSPTSVVNDYNNHGTAVSGPSGTIISPGGNDNVFDPGVNVAYWAWYTYNVVAAGESANEVAIGNPQGGVTRDFGNCEFDWLAGPHNDRHNAAQASAFQDYHDRIKDYFVQSGFGTADQFENLLNTTTGSQLQDFHN